MGDKKVTMGTTKSIIKDNTKTSLSNTTSGLEQKINNSRNTITKKMDNMEAHLKRYINEENEEALDTIKKYTDALYI